jgi:DsbC/DsbD-like thiol-disulfide interchange protein
MKSPIPLLAAVCVSMTSPALAGSSGWHHADGASLRIVTSGKQDVDGLLRGALEIRLKHGWKTYWLDPGDAGVPPTLGLTGAGSVEMAFPAPTRFDDGYAAWAGYDKPMALALTFDLGAGGTPASMEADAFLGLCETICIPVQARFTIDAAANEPRPEDEAIVARAFASLPGPARPGFEARAEAMGGTSLEVSVDVPNGSQVVDLFVASAGKVALGAPKRSGSTAFSVPIVRGADAMPASLAYTLVTSSGAVTGTLDLP